MKIKVILIVVTCIILLTFIGFFVFNNKTKNENSIRYTGETAQILVLDKTSQKPIINTKVRIYSDNGIRCITAPCPTNGKEWFGKTNNKGIVNLPTTYIQYKTFVQIGDVGEYLIHSDKIMSYYEVEI